LEKEMHFALYNIVTFFKNKDLAFINWIGLLLRPQMFFESEFIMKENQDIHNSKLEVHCYL
jgi:hypothetical protein